MGLTHYTTRVTGPKAVATLEFLVDTGAGYTVLPQATWRTLGLVPQRREVFTLADGTHIERDMSECLIIVEKMEGHTPVVLGEEDDTALLGVITLEQFGLMVNPFTRRLQPMRMMLA